MNDQSNAAPRCPRTLLVHIPRFNPPAEWSPNARVHPLRRWDAGRAAKDLAHWCTVLALDEEGGGPWQPPLAVHVVVGLKKGAKRQDQDNMIGRLKPCIDGLALALRVDDKHFATTVEQMRDPTGDGFVEITIREASPEPPEGDWLESRRN